MEQRAQNILLWSAIRARSCHLARPRTGRHAAEPQASGCEVRRDPPPRSRSNPACVDAVRVPCTTSHTTRWRMTVHPGPAESRCGASLLSTHSPRIPKCNACPPPNLSMDHPARRLQLCSGRDPVIGFFGIRDAFYLAPSLLLHAAQFILKGDFFGVHQASRPPLYHRVLRSLPCRPCSLPPLMLTCVYRRSIARVPRVPMRAEHLLEVPKVHLPRGVTSGQRQRRSGARRWCTVEKGL